jgi:hypothetical protein
MEEDLRLSSSGRGRTAVAGRFSLAGGGGGPAGMELWGERAGTGATLGPVGDVGDLVGTMPSSVTGGSSWAGERARLDAMP